MTQVLNEKAKGVYIISATPFTEVGTLDFASTDRLVDFYLQSGVSGITILGMMGEAPKLDSQESQEFLSHYLNRVDGRVPVIVGVSGAGNDNMKKLTQQAMDAGAAGVMIAPQASVKTEEQLYRYYANIFSLLGEDVPVCYQDYPLVTSVHISVPTLNRLIDDFPQLVMLKHEDWPGLNKISALRKSSETRRRISILVGNGGLFLPQELARGADGAMTGFAYPEMLVEVCDKFANGDATAAENIFDIYLPLVKHEQQPGYGLAVRKEVLRRRGVIQSAKTRAPGPSLTTEDHTDLDHLITRLEQKLKEV